MNLVTIRQCAAKGIAPENVIRRFVKQGAIKAVKAGSRNYIDADTVETEIAALMSGAAKEAQND